MDRAKTIAGPGSLTNRYRLLAAAPPVMLALFPSEGFAQVMNGFDLSGTSIDVDEVMSGGPPRDGIPSIDNPKFISAAKVDYLNDDDIVIGLVRGETARAYPIRILIWHEMVNDTIGNDAVVVTYCPLCGTAMVFGRKVRGQVRTFGVSGLLYRSDVLMYDRETESLWSQLAMKGVSGPAKGAELPWLTSEQMTWEAWKKRHPKGEVLSTDTGFERDYDGQPYASYFTSDRTMFPVPHSRTELANKELVIGIIVSGQARAYPVLKLPDGKTIKDKVGGEEVSVIYNAAQRHARVMDVKGKSITSVVAFWFAWQAFYPDTGLWQPDAR